MDGPPRGLDVLPAPADIRRLGGIQQADARDRPRPGVRPPPAGWRPRVGVPRAVRREFWSGVPMAVATWSLGGLYLALAPAIVAQAFGLNGTSIGGAAIGLLTGAGAIIPAATRAVPARAVAVAANLAMLTGIAAALAAIEVRSIALFLAASAVGGAGFGAGFSSWLRLLIPDVAPAERTRLYSAFYLVNYLAFGLPALVAGQVIGAVGLDATVLAYGALAMTAAVAGLRNEISTGRSKRNAQREARAVPMTGERSQSQWQANESLSWAVPQE
jgi:MFS family permease